jgi:hypothetical protein
VAKSGLAWGNAITPHGWPFQIFEIFEMEMWYLQHDFMKKEGERIHPLGGK